MTDLGSFAVESEELRKESAEWAGRKRHLTEARNLADNELRRGYKFGFFGIAAGLDGYHDEFISAMVAALRDGEDTFDFIAAGLAAAADAYDGADGTAAESAESLRGRLPR